MEKNLEERIEYSARLMYKHPDRVPIIIEKNEKIAIKIENYKYLLPKKINISEFMRIMRTKMNIAETQAIFTFVKSGDNYILVPMNETIESIYNLYKSKDNFLYIKFGIENTFG